MCRRSKSGKAQRDVAVAKIAVSLWEQMKVILEKHEALKKK